MRKIEGLSGELESWLREHRTLIREVRESTEIDECLFLSQASHADLDFLFGRITIDPLEEFARFLGNVEIDPAWAPGNKEASADG